MTPPPTSIDGTDITGATIDGQEVQEITIDGQTVFSATVFPVGYNNLIAWYPFDSSFYGGSNADDVTANLGGSGDDTAFDGTLINSPTYDQNGGGTDISAGDQSGAFDFESSNGESIRTSLNSLSFSELTLMGWVRPESFNSTSTIDPFFGQTAIGTTSDPEYTFFISGGDVFWDATDQSGNRNRIQTPGLSTGTWAHLAGVINPDGTTELFIDGVSQGTNSGLNMPYTTNRQFRIAEDDNPNPSSNGNFHSDGLIDDVRLYDVSLSASQISQIVSNTPHP